MRASFRLGAKETKNEVGWYAGCFLSICEIWIDKIACCDLSETKWKLRAKFWQKDREILSYYISKSSW